MAPTSHLADARQVVFQPALLGGDLGARIHVLRRAAAAGAEIADRRGSRREAEARRTAVTRARSNLDFDSSRRASTRSPVMAPSTKTTLPALRATPRPSASSAAIPTSISRIIPELEEFAPMGFVLVLQVASQQISISFWYASFEKNPPQQLVAQEQQVGVGRVGLAVVADLRALPRPARFPRPSRRRRRSCPAVPRAARLRPAAHCCAAGTSPARPSGRVCRAW